MPPYENNNSQPDTTKTIPSDEFNSFSNSNAPPLPSKNQLNENEVNSSSNGAMGGPPRYDQNQNVGYNSNQINFRNPPPTSNKGNFNDLDDDLSILIFY